MTDSHAHLSAQPLSTNLSATIEQFLNEGGKYILNVGFDPETINEVLSQYMKCQGAYPSVLLNAIGIHPDYFSSSNNDTGFSRFERAQKTLDMLEGMVSENLDKIHAIGETGLDYYHIFLDSAIKKEEREEIVDIQKIAFRRHAQLALKHSLPLTIHTRDIKDSDGAVLDALKILADIGKGNLRGSFHSYTGLSRHVEDIVGLGFHVGFNGIITYPSAGNVIENLMATPNERILLETDSPLLPVQSVRKDRKREDRYGKPADIPEILEFVAKSKGLSSKEMEDIVDENFRKLFLGD